MTYTLHSFGDLRLTDAEGNIVSFPEKGLLIIAFLLCSDRRIERRITLAQLLWESEDRGANLTNLRSTLLRIKRRQDEIGTQFISFNDTVVRLDDTALLSDLDLFQPQEGHQLARLKRVIECLRRSFLASAGFAGGKFNDWIAQERRRHCALLKELLKETCRRATTDAEIDIVKDGAILAFEIDPLDTDFQKILLDVFDARGEAEHLRGVFEKRSAFLAQSAATDPSVASVREDKAQRMQPSLARPSAAQLKAAIPRLVLLPPDTQSDSVNLAIAASSLIEDITIGFCALRSVQVIAPYSAVRISRQTDDKLDFFERHSVDYVLDTRLTELGDNVTLFVQLIFFTDNTIIWAERFRLDPVNLPRDRRVISRELALSVAGEIDRHELTRSHLELNPVAYHHYLIGRRHLGNLTLPNLRRARKELRASLQESPEFSPALSALARTYSKEWLLTARGDNDLLNSAETLARKAISAGRDLPDGYRELGVTKLLQSALDESAEALELAETLGPHYADVIADYADTLVHCSRPEVALEKIERAIELNPLSPDSYLWSAAGANYALRRFDVALDYIAMMDDSSLADRLSAASWAMLGDRQKARVFVHRVREANPDFDVDRWLALIPSKEQWHKDLYREGLKKAGF
ncbi:hypothetical protein C7U60_08785 [Mesorhizobium plurifarium]|uniref:membrane protein n=1 Tax=Sinorhizobium arboris TaxID=76745 RepID=UPI000424D0FA|nr:membrane protein [Sinorhizobium arboris]PST24707.1 hypothetical protein C7U60_08785 [Mesorhizobium plurifarium]